MTYKVAIIGAGPVGCLLSRLLTQGGIKTTIYESDVTPNFRSQGGSLDLHDDTGLKAIREAGLFEQFLSHARYDGQCLSIRDEKLVEHLQLGNNSASRKFQERPEIDRPVLRKMLADSLPKGTIRWGYRLHKIEDHGERKTLVFTNGEEETDFDYIVGAEGAWSKVRSVLSDRKPKSAAIGYCILRIPDAEKTYPFASELVNRGSCFVYGGGCYFFGMMQMGDGSLHMSFFWREDDEMWFEPGHSGVDVDDSKSLRKFILDKMQGWDSRLQEAVRKSVGEVQARTLYELPTEFSWEHKNGVTIIGDAAHVMTPFAGEGVNVGFEDALMLSRAIISAYKETEKEGALRRHEVVDQRVAAHERVMINRMQRYMQLSATMKEIKFYNNLTAYEVAVQMVEGIARFKTPWLLKPVASGVVYGYFMGRSAVQWVSAKINGVQDSL